MKVADLKKNIKKVISESKKTTDSTKTTSISKSKPKPKKKVMENERDEVGKFCMVHLPHKDSTIDEILTTHTLKEFAHSPVDMTKVAGVFKNEATARKLAEELLDHRSAVLGEAKDAEIQQKMEEIQGTKALIGATQQYFKLKPSLNEDESNKKLDELNGNLGKLEEELGRLQEEKSEIEATRKNKGVKPKPKAKKKDDKK